MKEIIDKAIEKHGRIIVSKYINPDTKIEHKRTLTRTEGGMYILEELTTDRSGIICEFSDENINTWDFNEVKKWCLAGIITQNMYENE